MMTQKEVDSLKNSIADARKKIEKFERASE